MIGHGIIRVDSPPDWTPENPQPRDWVAFADAPLHYLYAEETDGSPPAVLDHPALDNPHLIGWWDQTGVELLATDVAAYEAIRPLGNYVSGQATRNLFAHYFLGHKDCYVGDPQADTEVERRYPADNIPFAIELRHKYFGDNTNPAWDGWGWRAEFVGPAGQRDPSARAIAIYHDPEATNYWYTTGAFNQQESDWQIDEGGVPLLVWATEYNDAFLTGTGKPDPGDVHHAVLLGAAQEGYETLRADQEFTIHLYWETDQSGQTRPAGIQGWVDTGAKILGFAGTLYRITDGIAPGWAPGSLLRVNGHETTFLQLWNGETDLIQVDPHIHVSLAPAGSTIEIWA